MGITHKNMDEFLKSGHHSGLLKLQHSFVTHTYLTCGLKKCNEIVSKKDLNRKILNKVFKSDVH
jgi:hypothetical protein